MALNDRAEALGTFCALTPLRDEAAAKAAHDELLGWPRGAASPLARVATTHFARFVVLDALDRVDAAQPADTLGGPYLLFSAFFDGDPGLYLEALCAALPVEAHAVWRHCRDYAARPDTEGATFRRWLVAHRVPATAIFGAYAHADLPTIRRALRRRTLLGELAFAPADEDLRGRLDRLDADVLG